MKKTSKIITLFLIIFTFSIAVYALDDLWSASAIAYLIWSISPYVFLMALVNLVSNKTSEIAGLTITLFTCGFGIVFIIDAMFINLDAQSSLNFSVVPMWQWAGLLIVSLPLIILNKAKSK